MRAMGWAVHPRRVGSHIGPYATMDPTANRTALGTAGRRALISGASRVCGDTSRLAKHSGASLGFLWKNITRCNAYHNRTGFMPPFAWNESSVPMTSYFSLRIRKLSSLSCPRKGSPRRGRVTLDQTSSLEVSRNVEPTRSITPSGGPSNQSRTGASRLVRRRVGSASHRASEVKGCCFGRLDAGRPRDAALAHMQSDRICSCSGEGG